MQDEGGEEEVIRYIQGNLFDHVSPGVVIPHVCNDIGAWGAGFVVPLAKAFPQSKEAYLSLSHRRLGVTQFVGVDNGVTVANMIAQRGIGRSETGAIPLRYDALETCMKSVAEFCHDGLRIVCPEFGCGLAGGKWEIVERMIGMRWSHLDVAVVRLRKK